VKGQRGGGGGECGGVWWDAGHLAGGGHYGRESMAERRVLGLVKSREKRLYIMKLLYGVTSCFAHV